MSLFTFNRSWDMWEIHTHGSEVAFYTAGRITLRKEHADGRETLWSSGPETTQSTLQAPSTASDIETRRHIPDNTTAKFIAGHST